MSGCWRPGDEIVWESDIAHGDQDVASGRDCVELIPQDMVCCGDS